uniref:AlNc14C456G11759 protein n=1 Tax=Albugo laibachii Nc14 TaxID=890382 RepID=F0X018_9STRA|nr:AlNc14C456G11759 [Albugo laibachii Nc14]|eukprot:CCA27100.1 AlNc14C456G11759 [Albugo laibachii Nc14]
MVSHLLQWQSFVVSLRADTPRPFVFGLEKVFNAASNYACGCDTDSGYSHYYRLELCFASIYCNAQKFLCFRLFLMAVENPQRPFMIALDLSLTPHRSIHLILGRQQQMSRGFQYPRWYRRLPPDMTRSSRPEE